MNERRKFFILIVLLLLSLVLLIAVTGRVNTVFTNSLT